MDDVSGNSSLKGTASRQTLTVPGSLPKRTFAASDLCAVYTPLLFPCLAHETGRWLFTLWQKNGEMRAVVQRVTTASVTVDGSVVGQIDHGLLILLGVGHDDDQQDIIWLAGKIAGLRIFEDDEGRMNLDIREVEGSALVVSQFTLFGDCRKGRRPGFVAAAQPEKANSLYQSFVAELQGLGVPVETGTFQAHMDVKLVNDGPVTLLLDSKKTF